nr:MAG TPA: hypothetical protein [Caudoviricetes sp.]
MLLFYVLNISWFILFVNSFVGNIVLQFRYRKITCGLHCW